VSAAWHILIPARIGSTRLPEKALADLAGEPLVVRVWENALRASARSVHVATDSPRVAEAIQAAGGQAVLTGVAHDSGTSRLAEAAEKLGLSDDEIVVNVQGDEPEVPPECLKQLVELLEADSRARMATLWTTLDSAAQWRDPNVVKLIEDRMGRALYFSRAPIPHARDRTWPVGRARRHVGLYAYRADALAEWRALPPSELEQLEALEQLRALDAGWCIACARACRPIAPGIDTEFDLEAARQRFRRC